MSARFACPALRTQFSEIQLLDVVPEPTAVSLLGLGLGGRWVTRRTCRSRKSSAD